MDRKPNNFPQLDEQTASAIMSNVFAACEREPSAVPLSVLASYTQYRRDRYSLQKSILIFTLVVFLLLPICFIAPRFEVTEIGRSQTGIPTYEVNVHSILPVRLVSARLDDRPVAVYESDASIFTVEPAANGRLTITVTLINRQYDVWSIDVTGVDATAPVLEGSEVLGSTLRIFLSDEGVGVDFEKAYAVANDGSSIAVTGYSAEDGYIDFPFDQSLNIYIPDHNGNTLQLVLTVK